MFVGCLLTLLIQLHINIVAGQPKLRVQYLMPVNKNTMNIYSGKRTTPPQADGVS